VPTLSRRTPENADSSSRRAEQRDVAIKTVRRHNPDAVTVVGVPFGHTRALWIIPYGGQITVDGAAQTLRAEYA